LALELVRAVLASCNCFRLVSGNLFIFVALIGGEGLVVRLIQEFLIFIAAFLQVVTQASTVLDELRLSVVEDSLRLLGFQ